MSVKHEGTSEQNSGNDDSWKRKAIEFNFRDPEEGHLNI